MATASKGTAKTKEVTEKAGKGFVRALSPFQYEDLHLSRHQVFELQGKRNDEKLIAMRYVVRVEEGTELVQCAECGALFQDPHWLEAHGDMWHSLVCECGYSPQPGTLDPQTAMQRHIQRCDVMRQIKRTAHKDHVARAAELQKQGRGA